MKRVSLLAVAAIQSDDNLILIVEKDTVDQLSPILTAGELAFLRRGVEQEIKSFCFPRENTVIVVRLLNGEPHEENAEELARLAGNEVLREIDHYKLSSLTLLNFCRQNRILAVAEGLLLGSYQFLKHFSAPEKKQRNLQEVRLLTRDASAEQVAELNVLTDAVFMARDLVNEPYSHQSSMQLGEAIAEAGKQFGFHTEILGKEKIEALRMGGLLAVNRAAVDPPCFCVLEWKPDNARNEQPIVLIGKGVVYDTGGLSIKPTEGMDYMKCDMAGGAAVAGALAAVAKTNMPLHVVGLIPITDNLIGERAFAPGDVIRMYSGATVEVLNTDAEGRLILADAMHFAKQYNPMLALDFATLTGAAVRALGSQAICYMGTASEADKKALEQSGWATYERLVELPLWKEYGEELKSHVADMKNIGSGNAGMITAGKFLEHFASYPWLHLDIAGPAYLRTANGYRTKEGTGVGVRLAYHFLKNWTKSA